MRKVILASSSPRRRELLSLADIKFDICIKNIDETIEEGIDPATAAEMTAEKKAIAVAEINDEAIIIGADTIVVLDGRILGKPKDKDEAYDMLRSLSGREHTVITGVCLVLGKNIRTFHSETTVKFYDLTDDVIRHYITTGEPMDKAGAYGIQGKGCILVEKIDGDYFNVVGLPVAKLAREIKKMQEEFGDLQTEW